MSILAWGGWTFQIAEAAPTDFENAAVGFSTGLLHKIGVSHNQGYHFGVPHNMGYSILGSIVGSPYFGELPFRS